MFSALFAVFIAEPRTFAFAAPRRRLRHFSLAQMQPAAFAGTRVFENITKNSLFFCTKFFASQELTMLFCIRFCHRDVLLS